MLAWVCSSSAATVQKDNDKGGRVSRSQSVQVASSSSAASAKDSSHRGGDSASVSVSGDIPSSRLDTHTYLLGSGDVIHVSVWKEPDLSQTSVVRPDGNISLPLVGEVNVVGKGILEAQDIIRQRLQGMLTNPQVTIIVLEIHSRQVYITGEVGRPGAYPIEGSINVLQLIARAGGLTQFAHKKDIYILTKGAKRPLRFNYSRVVHGENQSQNIALVPGDTVVVP
ncbi:MAG: polysaccharide biosynthesis/export family protein [Acidobacteriaceae bacterium]